MVSLCRYPIAVFLQLFIIVGFCFAQQTGTPVFNEQDLEKYQGSRDAGREMPAGATRNMRQEPKDAGRSGASGRFEVPYTPFEQGARRIIISVTLNNSVTVPMILDTGSPGMIISEGLASRLGIFRGDEGKLIVTASGIGGKTPAVLTIMDSVRVGNAEDQFVPTLITAKLSDAFDGIVGMDFLSNYTVSVDAGRRVIVLSPAPASPQMPGGHDESWWRTQFRSFARMRSEWRAYREKLDRLRDDPQTIERMKRLADAQYREADKLFNRLNGYAIRHAVPMHWREF